MRLYALTLTNFGSFRGEHVFRFPDEPGLYFMQGLNEAEPRLEHNGAGKSTIWKALVWCITGKTAEGLKAGDISNWGVGKKTSVSLSYDTDGAVSMQVMTRTWSPNSWTLADLFGKTTDLAADPSNEALDALRFDLLPFLHSVMMSQDEPMFLDLSGSQQATLFANVLDLDEWLRYSEAANDKAQEQQELSRRIEDEVSILQGKLDGVQDFRQAIEEFEAERKKRIDALEPSYTSGCLTAKKLVKGHASLTTKLKRCLETWRSQDTECGDYDNARAKQLEIVRDAERELDRAEAKVGPYLQQIQFLTEHDHCPTCDQSIPINLRTHKLTAFKAGLRNVEGDAERAETELDTAKKHLANLADLLTKAEDQRRARRTELEQAEYDHVQSGRALANLNRELDATENQVEAIQAEVNPYQKLQDEGGNRARRLQNELGNRLAALDAANASCGLFSYWVKGFKEIRLQLISEALTELEIEANNEATALGLVDWELRFSVDRETKSGSIQRGFNVEVVGPANPKAVPWAAWSGGEKQRLRLAGQMGLSNLIRSRLGINVPLEVWDEPSKSLSPAGVVDLLQALERRAQVEQRTIWIVDHTAHSFGGFSGGAMITKTAKGSGIEQY